MMLIGGGPLTKVSTKQHEDTIAASEWFKGSLRRIYPGRKMPYPSLDINILPRNADKPKFAWRLAMIPSGLGFVHTSCNWNNDTRRPGSPVRQWSRGSNRGSCRYRYSYANDGDTVDSDFRCCSHPECENLCRWTGKIDSCDSRTWNFHTCGWSFE